MRSVGGCPLSPGRVNRAPGGGELITVDVHCHETMRPHDDDQVIPGGQFMLRQPKGFADSPLDGVPRDSVANATTDT